MIKLNGISTKKSESASYQKVHPPYAVVYWRCNVTSGIQDNETLLSTELGRCLQGIINGTRRYFDVVFPSGEVHTYTVEYSPSSPNANSDGMVISHRRNMEQDHFFEIVAGDLGYCRV